MTKPTDGKPIPKSPGLFMPVLDRKGMFDYRPDGENKRRPVKEDVREREQRKQ